MVKSTQPTGLVPLTVEMARLFSSQANKKVATAKPISERNQARVDEIVSGLLDCLTAAREAQKLVRSDNRKEIAWHLEQVARILLGGASLQEAAAAASTAGELLACLKPPASETIPVSESAILHEMKRFQLNGRVTPIVFAPDGKTLVAGSGDHTLRFFDVPNLEEKTQVKLEGRVHQIVFSRDGKMMAVSSGNGTVRRFDAVEQKEIGSFTAASFSVRHASLNQLAFLPNGNIVAAYPNHRNIQYFNETNPQQPNIFEFYDNIYELRFSSDGKFLAVEGSKKLTVLDTEQKKKIKTLELGFTPRFFRFSPDGNVLAAGAGSFFNEAKPQDPEKIASEYEEVVAQSANGKFLLISRRNSRQFRVYDTERLDGIEYFKAFSRRDLIKFSSDGQTLVGTAGKSLEVLDLTNRKTKKVLFERSLSDLAFSPDDKVLAAGSIGTLRLFDLTQ